MRPGWCACELNGAYFEERLPADVHKQHVVSFHHVLEHLLAGKRPDGRSGGGNETRAGQLVLTRGIRAAQ